MCVCISRVVFSKQVANYMCHLSSLCVSIVILARAIVTHRGSLFMSTIHSTTATHSTFFDHLLSLSLPLSPSLALCILYLNASCAHNKHIFLRLISYNGSPVSNVSIGLKRFRFLSSHQIHHLHQSVYTCSLYLLWRNNLSPSRPLHL